MRLAPIVAALCLLLGLGALPASADGVDAAVAAYRGSGLEIQPDAEAAANASAARQAADQTVSHAAIGHLTSVCSRAAEIVGSGPSVELVFGGFRGSANHWSKLSDPGWTSMGTGAVVGADQKVYVSVVFCQSADTAPAVPPNPAQTPTPSEPPPPAVAPSQDRADAPKPPPNPPVPKAPEIEVDLVRLLAAILTTSLDSLTAENDAHDPIAAIFDRFVNLPSGVRVV